MTFKVNCTDVRITKAIDVIANLQSYGTKVTIYDPWASKKVVEEVYGLKLVNDMPASTFNAIILAAAHDFFLELDLRSMLVPNGVLYDLKGVLKCKIDGILYAASFPSFYIHIVQIHIM